MRRLLCFQAHSAAEVPAGPAARTAHETLPAAQTYAERVADARSVAGWLTPPASAVPLVRALLKRKKREKPGKTLLQPHALAGEGHDPRRGLLARQHVAHVLHVGFRMAEPMLQSLAERVLAAAVGTGLEAVLRTFAPAGEIVFAPQAFGGQRIALGKAEIHPFARTV